MAVTGPKKRRPKGKGGRRFRHFRHRYKVVVLSTPAKLEKVLNDQENGQATIDRFIERPRGVKWAVIDIREEVDE